MAEKLQKTFNSKAYRRTLAVSVLALNAAIMPQDLSAFPPPARADNMFEEKIYARPDQVAPQSPTDEAPVQILSPLTLSEAWANFGAPEDVIDGISRQSSEVQDKLAARTAELFSNRDFLSVLENASGGKAKNIDKLLATIASIPPEMDIITLAYTKIAPEQNNAVWAEFQAQSEPAFYRHLAANHADELKSAGFCDYAISCLERGLSPTTEDGVPYNVDVDHVVERAGGGRMSLEKSIDPATGGPETFPVNHIGNLCLIMKSWHHAKNDLNGAQNIGATPVGETRMLCMALPPPDKRAALLGAELVQPYLPPTGRDSIYFTQGATQLLTKKMEDIASEADFGAETGEKLFKAIFQPDFSHTLNLWSRVTEHIENMAADGSLRPQEAGSLQETCDTFLTPLISASNKVHIPADALAKLSKIGDRMQTVITALHDKKFGKQQPQQAQKAQGISHNGHA